MFELLLALTALVLGIGTATAYSRTKDILHPMLFLGPLFLYSCVLEPWLVRHDLDQFFRYPEDLNVVLLLNLLGATGLVLGTLHLPRAGRAGERGARIQAPLQNGERVKLRWIGFVLAVSALAAYGYGIVNEGGFVAAFSRVKGGGYTDYGYVNEAMNLSLVAVAMVALSQYRRKWTGQGLLLLALGLLPNLVQGTFGGRRGPLFLALAAAMIAWTITRPKAPRLWVLGCALASVLLSVAFIGSQRQHLYLGSAEPEIKWEKFLGALRQGEVSEGNNFVHGAGLVLATYHSGSFTWGRKLAVNLLVRPIPKQLWPSKYEDVEATFVTSEHHRGHDRESDWLAAVGWVPWSGSSTMCISDLFSEFGWGAVVALYLVGRGFAALRFRARIHGGVWVLLHLETLTLSIYLATQSFSAFYYRYLILAVPTVIAWKLYVHRQCRSAVSRQPTTRLRSRAGFTRSMTG